MNGSASRLLLVMPPQKGLLEGFSSSLVALAGYLRHNAPDIPVDLVDFGTVDESGLASEIPELIESSRGQQLFVGLTTTTASYQAALRVARLFKFFDPGTMVVFGGHHASPQAKVVLESHPGVVDFVIRGEGEVGLRELIRRYPRVADVPNLSYRKGQEVKNNRSAPLLRPEELDPLPALLPDQINRTAPGKFGQVTYVSARGCPLGCAFCAVGQQKMRAKSVDAVVADLRHLVHDHGYRRIAIEDNFFAHSPRRTRELSAGIEALQKEQSFEWDCQTRVESLKSPDIVAALARAGCSAVYLGVEAFEEEQLVYLAKSARPERYLRTLENRVVPQILDAGMDCYVNLQVGLPAEIPSEWKTTRERIAALGHIGDARGKQITLFPQLHVVYPGTGHFRRALQEAWFGPLDSDVFEAFTPWEAEQEPIVTWMGRRFAHGTGGIPIGILHRESLQQGEFLIDAAAVLTIEQRLAGLDELPAVTVFSYGTHLAASDGGASGPNPHPPLELVSA